jgi:hypothetical protein
MLAVFEGDADRIAVEDLYALLVSTAATDRKRTLRLTMLRGLAIRTSQN